MKVKNIRLINFRNYGDQKVELNEQLNIFIGKNGQGKTNLLEGIYACAMGKSFRTNRDKELINFEKDVAYIGIIVEIDENEKLIELRLDTNNKKRIKINKFEIKNLKELDSGLNVVVFTPDDLNLVKKGPSVRRNFIDVGISQIKPVYKYNLNRYNKILFQRNNLLKSGKSKTDIINLLEVFNLQLVSVGVEVIKSRINYINKLFEIASDINNRLTLNKESLTLSYSSSFNVNSSDKKTIEKNFLNKLKANREKELYTGYTSVGPHRDDLKIKMNNMDARIFASQGQQRTIVLSMKLAEVEIIKMDKGTYPVLLLDDVFSELDVERRKYLFKTLKNTQTIITSTEINNLQELKDIHKSIFYIENGIIKG